MTMDLKRIGKVVSAPIWLPLMPLTRTFKRLYRTHDNQRVLIGQLKDEILVKLDNRKKARQVKEVPFEQAIRIAESNAAKRGEEFSLDKRRHELLLKKRLILLFAYSILIIGLLAITYGLLVNGLMMLASALSIAIYTVPTQFRLWQIDNRRLTREEMGSFECFRKESKWLLDSLNPDFKINKSKTLLTALLVVCITMPALSFAENLNDLNTAADRGTDISRQAMVTLFGQIVNDPLNGITEDGGDTLVSQILKIFSSTLLIVGTAMGGFLVLQKTAQTAHDGQFLDRERGSFWMPIRVLAAFSMLTPLPNGWSLSALIMLYAAAKVGVGGANLATDVTVDAFMAGQTFVLQPVAPSTTSLARSLFEADVCMYGINASLEQEKQSGGIVFSSDYINQSPMNNGFILKSRSYTCGGATIAIEENDSLLAKFGITNKIDVSAIKNAHIEGLNEMQRALRKGAQNFVNGVLSRQADENASLINAESIIQHASQVYENRVTAAIRSSNVNNQLQNLTNQVAETIKSEGWFSLGSWYQTLAVANNRVANSAAAKGSAFGSSTGQQPVSVDVYKLALMAYKAQKSITDNSNAGILTAKSSYESNEIKDAGSFFGYVFGVMGQDITGTLVSMSENDTGQVNPIISMKNLGDRLIAGAETSFVAYGAAKAIAAGANETFVGWVANKFVGATAAFKAIVDFVGPYVAVLLIMLIGSGITLSVYIPLMPFIIWLAACINYLVIIGEGIFASALWAFSHLLGTGDGMGSKTTHGYIFLLNLMFRPILQVGGFLLGGGIVVVGGTFLNKMLPTAIANAQFDSFTGIASIIGFLLIYCSLSITIVGSSFSLTNIVPDQVINWVGGHMPSSLGRDTTDKVSHATNILANKTENTLNTKNPNGKSKPNKVPENSIK